MSYCSRDAAAFFSVRFLAVITSGRTVKIADLAEELEVSKITIRRWAEAFSRHYPIRIEEGVILTEEVSS